MRACPYCAELIQEAAVVCRFCGRDVPSAAVRAASKAAAAKTSRRVLILVAIVLGGSLAMMLVAWMITPAPGASPPRRPVVALDVDGSIRGGMVLELKNTNDLPLISIDLDVRAAVGATRYDCAIDRIEPHATGSIRLAECVNRSGERFPASSLKVDHISVEASIDGDRRSTMLRFR